MATIVGVQFQKNGKIYNFDANDLEIRANDFVIVDTTHGIDIGQAVSGNREAAENDMKIPLKKVLRIATEKDLNISAENRKREREAYEICQKKIAEHKLDMKLVSVEYAFDNSKALFYFTANGRVDFRSLVKDLASVFKMRIELRQIGVRDEARMLGGLGPCGRPICCGSFLDEFQPVSIKMAKEQNLSLNPTKISGVCGRLMCCLKYEQDHYEQTRKIMPRLGKEVNTPDGCGIVSDLNIVKETVFVRISNGDSSEIKEYPLDKIEKTVPAHVSLQNDTQAPVKDEPPKDAAVQSRPEIRLSGESEIQDKPRSKKARSEKNAGAANSDKNREQQKKPGRNDAPRANRALGKPVMRENPKKVDNVANSTPGDDSKKESAANWAEAVRKAIDSMN